MNNIISKQLKKCKVAQVPEFDENTTHLVIPKLSEISNKNFVVSHYYVIELEDYIIHPPENFTLHQNWNGNVIPTSKYYKCECLSVMGKMVKIEGVGFDFENQIDLNTSWCGWVPMKSIKIIKELV